MNHSLRKTFSATILPLLTLPITARPLVVNVVMTCNILILSFQT